MIDIAALVRNQAVAVGASGWLDRLSGLVEDVVRDWNLTLGEVYHEATEAFVANVTLADGTPAVLKVGIPHPGDRANREITVLRLTGGDGCVRLLRHDIARGALLLERLGPSMYELGVPYRRRLEILTDLAARVWRPAPGCGLPTGADRARWLAEVLVANWEELGRPCSEQAVAQALVCADGFRLVDPDGLLAEPEYDLGVLMREDPLELLAGDPYARARWLAVRCGLDPVAIWEWGVLERVATGLLCTRFDFQPIGRHLLLVSDLLARSTTL